MTTELEDIQALAADYDEKTVMLSGESVAVLFYGLEAVKSLEYWKQDREETISPEDRDEIERMVDIAFYQVMSEVILIYPSEARMFHQESVVVAGNVIQFVENSAHFMAGYYRQNTAAINDHWKNRFYLAEGTYYLTFFGARAAGGGILDVWIDGEALAQVDFYNATTVVNQKLTVTIEVVGSGVHMIEGKVTSKVPASSGYNAWITYMYIREAAFVG